MNGISAGNCSFIDELLAEYRKNQLFLSEQKPAFSPQYVFPLKPQPLLPRPLLQFDTLSTVTVTVPKEQLSLIRAQRPIEQVGWYKLRQTEHDKKEIEKVLSAFDQQLDVTIKGISVMRRTHLVAELYFQAVTELPPGRHLVITTTEEQAHVYKTLQSETSLDAMHTLWRVAIERMPDHALLVARCLKLLISSFTWKNHQNKFHYEAMGRALALLAYFPKEHVLQGIAKNKSLQTHGAVEKLRGALFANIYNLFGFTTSDKEISVRKILDAIDEALLHLEKNRADHRPTDGFKTRLKEIGNFLKISGTFSQGSVIKEQLDRSLILGMVDKKEPEGVVIYQAFYLFVMRLSSLSREPPLAIDSSSYPANDTIESCLTTFPYQLQLVTWGYDLERSQGLHSDSLVMSLDTLQKLQPEQQKGLFKIPLRALYVIAAESKKQYESNQAFYQATQKVLEEAKKQFPNEPVPYHVICYDQ